MRSRARKRILHQLYIPVSYTHLEKLFDAEGHLTDEGLYALKDGTLDDLGALEVAEHLSFCDYCLLPVSYTHLDVYKRQEKQIANAELKLSDTQTDAQKSYDQAVEDLSLIHI